LRALIPVFALTVAAVAAITDPSSAADLILAGLAVGAFVAWAYVPRVSLLALSLAVVVPVVVAQRSGQLEPLLFEVSLLGFVIGRWASSPGAAVALGLLVTLSPVAASLIQDPSEIAVGIWVMGIAFPWVLGRTAARQGELAAQLDATRRELAEQALVTERRRVARDVHDFVGYGLAAVVLQVTSARHVLRRDPAAAEEALRSAEEVGRRSMRELRRTIALLRGKDEAAVVPPLPSAGEIRTLVDDARAGGLAVELRMRGDLSLIAPSVGVALYRIGQEALANAARHAPSARTVLAVEVADGRACLIAETTGPTVAGPGRRSGPTPVRPERHAGASNRTRRRVHGRADNRGLACQLSATAGGQGRDARCGRREPVIRVALVDDQAIVRAGLARILSPTDGFEVVAECVDGHQAVEAPRGAPGCRPDGHSHAGA
jgi:signal transduction histidine kinase